VRTPFLFAALFIVLASACTRGGAAGPGNSPSPRAEPATTGTETSVNVSRFALRTACALPRRELARVWAGYHPERSGEIQYVPQEPNFIGAWQSHSGPWPYLQEIPMFFYGPGHVPATGEVRRPVTMADLAPTIASFIGFDFDAPDGRPMTEAILAGQDPPKVVVTVVWDGAGRNVLEAYPNAWPGLRGLIPQGVWFENATDGSSPSVTPAIHTTIGTGAHPRTHGIMDLQFEVDGQLVPDKDVPRLLLVPTLADLYDRARGNQPLIASLSEQKMLGMIGHGSYLEGADRDFLIPPKGSTWVLEGDNAPYFQLPPYANDVPGLEESVRAIDLEDGRLDDTWLGQQILNNPPDITFTPAFAEHQTRVLAEVIRREGFGQDDVPDLFFVNYKQIDKTGHRWGFPTPQMEANVRASDRAFSELVHILDREVGEGEWVMALTADHGITPAAETTGAFIIDPAIMEQDLVAQFDGDGDDRSVVRKVRVTQAWLDEAELEENGHTLDDVARFLMAYTKAENAADPSTVPADQVDDPVFAAAFPGRALESPDLDCLPPSVTS
jgi:Type I phosphodiesterase / nucleotide pyrophosphatase